MKKVVFLDWKGFLRIAKDLVKEESDEAKLRSAVNRSYFTAFHMSILFAEAHYSFTKDKYRNDHKRILEEFRKKEDKEVKRIGRELDSLQDDRRKADYVDTLNVGSKSANLSIMRADDIIDSLDLTSKRIS